MESITAPHSIDNDKKSAIDQPLEAAHEKANNEFVSCFIEAYNQKKYLSSSFFGKIIMATTENYSKSVEMVNALINPALVSAENLDETVEKFDALLDFFIATSEKSSATRAGLFEAIGAAFATYMNLRGFYQKILKLINSTSQIIKEHESKKTLFNREIQTIETKLKVLKTTNNGTAFQKNTLTRQLEQTQQQLTETTQAILKLNNKNTLLNERISFLRKLDNTESTVFPINDELWHSEIKFFFWEQDGGQPDFNKKKALEAVEAQNIVELLTLTLALPKSRIPAIEILKIIKKMPPLTQEQATLAIKKLNEIKDSYCSDKKEDVVANFNNLYETINQKVAIVASAPSADILPENTIIPSVPFAETFSAAAEDLSEEPSLEEEADEEFHDTNEGYEIECGLREMNMWKEQNPRKFKFISEKAVASVEARDWSAPSNG